MIMRKTLTLLAILSVAGISCTNDIEDKAAMPNTLESKLTGDRFGECEDGVLLVQLTEDAASEWYNGTLSMEGLSEASVAPVFPVDIENDLTAKRHNLHRWFTVRFDTSISVESMARTLAADTKVSAIEYNTFVDKDVTPISIECKETVSTRAAATNLPFNDEKLSVQWNLINTGDKSISETAAEGADVGVKDAWRLTAGDPRVIVAVMDEGVKYDHEDLKDAMWVNEAEKKGKEGVDDDNNGYVDDIYGWNFLHTEKYPKEISWNEPGDVSHGTHVAGTVAAVNNNGIGVSGVAGGTGKGDGCRIMSCQVFSGSSSATVGARSRAYHYAAQMGASILQCSYGQEAGYITSDQGFETTYNVEIAALRYFREFGNSVNGSPVNKNIIVFAAGNDGSSISGYPAAHKEFISVTAFGPDYLPTNYTNYGPGSNIAAPGGDISINMSTTSERAQILSTTAVESENYDSNYGWMQGTSMACPHVSGVVALGLSYALQLGKTFDYDEFLGILYSSVNDLDYYIETCTKEANGVTLDLTPFWRQMGTGALDTWRFLMNLEGTPNIVAKVGEESKVSLVPCFGEPAANLTYTRIEISDEARETLGIEGEPYIDNGRLFVKCNKYGSAKIRIYAIAGGDKEATPAVMGGSEFYREVSLLSRVSIAENGGWL